MSGMVQASELAHEYTIFFNVSGHPFGFVGSTALTEDKLSVGHVTIFHPRAKAQTATEMTGFLKFAEK